MNAGWAGGLATAASEAQIEMARRVVVEVDVAFGQRLHQIDSAARRVHLAPRYNVGRGSRGHQIPPTKHPGLKIPAGSKADLSRRISASAPPLGVSKNSSELRMAGA